MNLENIIDDELVAICRARNLTNQPNERRAYCIVPRGTQWEVMQVREAVKICIQVPNYHIAKKRKAA